LKSPSSLWDGPSGFGNNRPGMKLPFTDHSLFAAPAVTCAIVALPPGKAPAMGKRIASQSANVPTVCLAVAIRISRAAFQGMIRKADEIRDQIIGGWLNLG
jgi:hypothetical protein